MKVCRGVSKNDRPDFMKTLGMPRQKFMTKLFPAGDATRFRRLKRPVSTASCLGCDLRRPRSSIAKSRTLRSACEKRGVGVRRESWVQEFNLTQLG